MTGKQFAGALGFAFVAAWIGFGFGYAILCLVGAAAFYVAEAVRKGEIDLTEVQGRFAPPVRSTPKPPRRVK